MSRAAVLCAAMMLLAAFAAADDTSPFSKTVRVYKNAERRMDFASWLRDREAGFGAVVWIESLPHKGQLFLSPRPKPFNGSESSRELKPPERTPIATLPEGQRSFDSAQQLMYYKADAATFQSGTEDTFGFKVTGGPDGSKVLMGSVVLNLTNRAPIAFPARFTSHSGKGRFVSLLFRDFDEPKYLTKQQYQNGESQEIARVEVNQLINDVCRITVVNDSASGSHDVDGNSLPSVIKAPYHLFINPPAGDDQSWEKCGFFFRVQDVNGAWSTPAMVEMRRGGAASAPKAFSGAVPARLGTDSIVSITLQSSSDNGQSGRRFFVRATPEVGQLVLRNYEGGGVLDATPPELVVRGTLPTPFQLPKHNKRSSRVRLYYALPNATEKNPLPPVVTLTWYVEDDGGKSEDATVTISLIGKDAQVGPQCGTTTVDPVFIDKPTGPITLSYNVSAGGAVSRLQLVRTPRGSDSIIGNFWVSRRITDSTPYHKLRLGSSFNDAQQQLSFRVNPGAIIPAGGVTLQYQFRASNFVKQSCIGTILVVIRTHDQPLPTDPNTGKVDNSAPAVRFESATLYHYALLPLRGYANGSFANSTSSLKGAHILSTPQFGSLHLVKEDLPFKRGGAGEMCRRIECKNYDAGPIASGQDVMSQVYLPDFGLDYDSRIYVLYKAPSVMPVPDGKDSFTYQFVSDSGELSTRTQKVIVSLKKGSLLSREYYFDKPTDGQSARVVVQLSNLTLEQERVYVMPRNLQHHHGRKARFNLFQYTGLDGTRPKIDTLLKESDFQGVSKKWLTDDKARVVLMPNLKTMRQTFSFHVIRIPRKQDGSLDAGSAVEEKVWVIRRNQAPTWDESNCTIRVNCVDADGNKMRASDTPKPFFFAVNDKDADDISFVLRRAPKFGQIYYERNEISGVVQRAVRRGSRMRMKKDTAGFNDLVVMRYKHKPSTVLTLNKEYPIIDTFVVGAYDGAAYARDLQVQVKIEAPADGSVGKLVDIKRNYKSYRSNIVSQSLAVGIATMVALVLTAIAIAIIVRKRNEAKRRYTQLPAMRDQPQAGAGRGREMKPPVREAPVTFIKTAPAPTPSNGNGNGAPAPAPAPAATQSPPKPTVGSDADEVAIRDEA